MGTRKEDELLRFRLVAASTRAAVKFSTGGKLKTGRNAPRPVTVPSLRFTTLDAVTRTTQKDK